MVLNEMEKRQLLLSSDSPIGDKGDRMRLFLTDEGYGKALKNQGNGHRRAVWLYSVWRRKRLLRS